MTYPVLSNALSPQAQAKLEPPRPVATRPARYPFADMAHGDSFHVPLPQDQQEAWKVEQRVRNAVSQRNRAKLAKFAVIKHAAYALLEVVRIA